MMGRVKPPHDRLRSLVAALVLTLPAPLTAVLLPGAGSAPAAVEPHASPPAVSAPLSPAARAAKPSFGVQYHGLWEVYTWRERRKVLDNLVALGATWVRLDVGWTNIQPNPGGYDTAYGVPFVDRIIQMARQRGLKVLVTFWRTPYWANGGRGEVAPPDDPETFARALGWAVHHWRKQVTHWEIWNEPNLDDYFTGEDPATYVPLLCAAYRAAKEANPAAKVVFGGRGLQRRRRGSSARTTRARAAASTSWPCTRTSPRPTPRRAHRAARRSGSSAT